MFIAFKQHRLNKLCHISVADMADSFSAKYFRLKHSRHDAEESTGPAQPSTWKQFMILAAQEKGVPVLYTYST